MNFTKSLKPFFGLKHCTLRCLLFWRFPVCVVCVVALRHVLSGGKERPDLHADGLQRIPAALPVHPHNAIVCAMLGHLVRVGSAHVVSAVGIG